MLTLVICSILLSVSNCAVIKTAQTLPREWDVKDGNDLRNKIPTLPPLNWDKSTAKPYDWWKKVLTSRSHYPYKTTKNPTDWNRSRAKLIDWNETAKPFDRDKSTVKPFDWNRFTAKFYNWDKSTAKPSNLDKFSVKHFDWDSPTAKPFDRDKLNADPFDWNKFAIDWDWNRFTRKPFDWEKFTAKPFDWDRPTVKPNMDKFTLDPFDWNKFTFDWNKFTFDWNKFTIDWNRNRFTVEPYEITLPPMDFNYYHRETDNTTLKVGIFVSLTIGVILIAVCKYALCSSKRSSGTSTPILHPPPRRTIPPPPQNRTGQNSSVQTVTLLREELFATAPPVHSRGPSNAGNFDDRPPGYSDVIMGDFGQNNYFPEVKPIIPETPPPQYDEKNIMRY